MGGYICEPKVLGSDFVTPEEMKQRTKRFALEVLELAAELPDSQVGRIIRGQLVRSGTSVGANYRAACIAQSKASFVAKLSIVIEEADESAFWLEFIIDEKLMKRELVEPLLNEAGELTSIFISSRKTIQVNNK